MGLLRNIRAAFHKSWCSQCKTPMEEQNRRLFALPMTVGHYVSHKDAAYYLRVLRPVNQKADIPPGTYACGAIAYRCPECGKRMVKLSIFLPVRDQEIPEEDLLFETGEMDELFINR